MEFFRRAPLAPGRLAVFPGTFNPPTLAHLAMARAALEHAGEVLFVLPRRFPHKSYQGAPFGARVAMLQAAAEGEPRYSIAASRRGLFIEIARECRRAYGVHKRLAMVCGRDAAERIMTWDYGEPGFAAAMLRVFDLLVAARQGAYEAPAGLRGRIHPLALNPAVDRISATEVRERIAAGEPWRHLVPPKVAPLIGRFYS